MPSFDEMKAKIQGYVGQFLATKAQLLDARNKLSNLRALAAQKGYATIGGKTYTLAQIQTMQDENYRLVNEGTTWERKLSESMEQMKRLQETEFPVIDGIASLEAAPLVVVAWVTGAVVLATGIAFFLSRVKSHLNKLAGSVAGGLMGFGTIAAILGIGYVAVKVFGGRSRG